MWPFKSSPPSPLDPTIISGSFPNTLKGCEKQTSTLFTCLETLLTTPNPTVSSCSKLIKSYNDCNERRQSEKRNDKFNRVQERVPEEYRYERK
ncbi:hypothetical protein TrVE_jg12037 [Triparma verrucosa]|uniref:Uncharacterized protein n=1 Tax=Triparma verrucosa TaxID=1606542 RepID=A0A9W7F536_9STRA|nr:hypothetical protein TrVE_jg12037 [Triparma verrucosa]